MSPNPVSTLSPRVYDLFGEHCLENPSRQRSPSGGIVTDEFGSSTGSPDIRL